MNVFVPDKSKLRALSYLWAPKLQHCDALTVSDIGQNTIEELGNYISFSNFYFLKNVFCIYIYKYFVTALACFITFYFCCISVYGWMDVYLCVCICIPFIIWCSIIAYILNICFFISQCTLCINSISVLLQLNSTLVGHSTYSWFRKSLTLACNIISMTGTKQDTFLELAQSPNKHKHAHAIIMDKNFNELKWLFLSITFSI